MDLGAITESQSFFNTAATEYFERYSHSALASDEKLVARLVKKLHFENDTCNFITVPVYAGDLLLKNYLNGIRSALQRQHFNICVFVNATWDRFPEQDFKNACAYNNTIINQFNEDCGFAGASLLTGYLPGPVSMGRVRKIMVDSLIRYCIEKNIDDPLILCNDVDQIACSPDYLSAIADVFNQPIKPVCAAAPIGYGYKGKNALGLPAGVHIPELHLFNRVQDAINLCTREGSIGAEPEIWPEGANFAFTGSAYCCAGGFDARRTNGEDDTMGFALKLLWENAGANQLNLKWQAPVYENSAWIVTDPRRVLAAIYAGRTGIEAWSWQSFTENPGSKLNTHELALACSKKKGLLQSENIRMLLDKENNKNWEFVTDRIGWLFCRSVVFDRRARNFEQFKAVANVFGLSISGGKLNYDPLEFEAAINWDESTLLSDLLDTFH